VTDIGSACERERDWLIGFVRDLAALESPSTDSAALEACAAWLAAQLTGAGATVARLPGGPTADHVLAEWPAAGPRVLLLGHFDTVWAVGQSARMPIEERDGRLFGPGVLDMKAGLGIGLLAVRALREGTPSHRAPHVSLLATSDEEVGSHSSRPTIERLARESAAVLVLEPALPGGAVKTSRKGVGEFRITVHGVSAHAGVDPGAGASAINELARQILAIDRLNDRQRGISVNVGVVEGGSRSNVVAEDARAQVDVRVARASDAEVMTAALRALAPADPRVRLEVTGGLNRPPMERSPGTVRLYALAREVARELGRDLGEGATGGGSDGNFTAALGVPTLDGLGAVGDGPHALHEHVVIADLPWRAALVAGLLARLAEVA
jgi:glutamate carboxypeptidase